MTPPFTTGLAITTALIFWSAPTHAGDEPVFEWQRADWRLELSALTSFDSDPDRKGDVTGALVFDYELPFTSEATVLDRSTFSFRLRPFMYYHQDDFEPDDIFAAGGGLAYRVYQHRDTYSGFFGEFAGEIILQSEKFKGISTQFNFLPQFGVGYQSDDQWFVTLRFQHASNAGFGDKNNSVNSVGLAAGFRF